MRQELTFNIRQNNYAVRKHYFKTNKKSININDVDTNKEVLSDKGSYGKQGANKYFIGYLTYDFRPLCIIIKEINLYTDHINILANSNEFLKYTEIWKMIEALFNEKFKRWLYNKKNWLYNKPTHNNEYIWNKNSPFNE